MKTTTKENLKYAFGSLIKNDSAVSAAKSIPGYVPVIVAFIATFLPVIPLMVSTANTYGSQFIKSQDYNISLYQTSLLMSAKEDGNEFFLNNGELLRYNGGQPVNTNGTIEDTKLGEYVINDGESETIAFELYYSNRMNTGASEEIIKTLISQITDTTYLTGTKYLKDSGDAETYINQKKSALQEGEKYEPTYYRPSFTIIYKLGIYTSINSGTKKVATTGGDWKHSDLSDGLLTRVLSVDNEKYGDDLFSKDTNGAYKLLRNTNFRSDVQQNMNKVYDEAYITTKNNSLLTYSLLFYGIYFLLIIFMGLMIFLLTRGKNNPMNYMSFWLSLKIAAWASISPALLALVLGFLLSNFATMIFIVLYGVRVMWLSMRQLRPVA